MQALTRQGYMQTTQSRDLIEDPGMPHFIKNCLFCGALFRLNIAIVNKCWYCGTGVA